MKKIASIVVSFLIGFFIFFAVIKWTGWQEISKSFNLFLSHIGFSIVVLTILIWLTGTWKWKLVLSNYGYNYSFFKLVEIYFASFSFTYLTPIALIGGEGFRAYALANKASIPLGKNIAVLTVEKILSVIVLSLFLLFGFISFIFLTGFYSQYLEILLIVFGVSLIFLYFFIHFKLYRKENLIKCILKILKLNNNNLAYNFSNDVCSFFYERKKLFWKICFVSFLRYFTIFVRTGLLLYFLIGNLNIFLTASIMFFVYTSYLIPTPASIGTLEAAQVFAFNSLGLLDTTGITFSIILRSAELFVCLLGILLLLKFGFFLFFNIIKKI